MEMKALRRLVGIIVIAVAAIAIAAPAASGYPTDPADGVTPVPASVRSTQSGQTKAIRFPSGDHAGFASMRASCVSCVTPLVATFSTKTSVLSRSLAVGSLAARVLANAMNLPSFDQLGSTSKPAALVRRATFRPSASMT